MTAGPCTTRALIERLIREAGAVDAVTAVRGKARQAIDSFVSVFGEPQEMPLDLLALASFLGIQTSDERPTFSPDAELAPDGEGGVKMRLNPDRPETRQRFSIGHEITHTFFPDHTSHVWPRADARYRDLSRPDDYLEMLCDVGAAELVLPRRWFIPDAAEVRDAAGLVELARRYKASREATIRRYGELHPEEGAAVFFTWKLKPAQERSIGNPNQLTLFNTDPRADALAARRLRIEYVIPSEPLRRSGIYLPRDKSVENEGPIYQAASTGVPCDGKSDLDLGAASGTYKISAVPLWTPDDDTGPQGEVAVAAILFPLKVRRPRSKPNPNQPSLFG